jgi:hypothetical protein
VDARDKRGHDDGIRYLTRSIMARPEHRHWVSKHDPEKLVLGSDPGMVSRFSDKIMLKRNLAGAGTSVT